MMNADKIIAAILLCTLIYGVAAAKNKVLPDTYQVRNIHAKVAEGYDTAEVRDICGNFRFNEREVREFFRKADVISEHVRQHGYDWLPCCVIGEMAWNGELATWEIEASATGQIKFSDGRVIFFGCREACSRLFKDK